MVASLFTPSRAPQANYDWIDLASSTGFVVFDGFNAIDSTGNNYTLFDSSKSTSLVTVGAIGDVIPRSTSFATTADAVQPNLELDVDFDTSEFQLPRTIKGDVMVGLAIGGDDAAGQNISGVYVIAKLRKWNAGTTTETPIASTQSETSTVNLSTTRDITLKINVANTTLIKKGEQIRLTIEVYTQDPVAGKIRLPHDPNNAAIADGDGGAGAMLAGATKLSVAIPFRINI